MQWFASYHTCDMVQGICGSCILAASHKPAHPPRCYTLHPAFVPCLTYITSHSFCQKVQPEPKQVLGLGVRSFLEIVDLTHPCS
jgi:hypothetical protein